uniref:Alstrom syndrome protein 1 n=1 Tax=Haemonchus contortus TaxID=6289 RepID=A0A7I4Z2X7_HAECO
MRFRSTILVVLVVVLVLGADGARDRSRKKNRDKGKSAETESALDDDNRRGFGESEGLTEKNRERNRERERERERGMGMGEREKEEESSSEEKDDDKKEKNATDAKEIVIPEARLRRYRGYDEEFWHGNKRSISDNKDDGMLLHKKSSELNEGKHIPLNEVQDKRHHIKRYRVRRWPLPAKPTHHGRSHKKLRLRDKKKSEVDVKMHRAMRIRRAERIQEEEEEKKHQKDMKKDSSSSQSNESEEKPQRRVRSLVTRELIPKGYPPHEQQSEEAMERDKTLRSLYSSILF